MLTELLKSTITATLVMLSYACGTQPESLPELMDPEYQDPKLISYVRLFDLNFNSDVEGGHIKITFEKLESPSVGVCEYSPTSRHVKIDPEYWKQATKPARESLMFHELAHCRYLIQHDETIIDRDQYGNDIPASIMSPYNIGYMEAYTTHHKHYIKELRNKIEDKHYTTNEYLSDN